MTGATLSRYRLVERLGAGSMGVVYRAEDLQLRRPVALKIVPRDGPEARGVDHLLAEARAASALSHPNLAVIYEVDEGALDGRPVGFIAMELVDGRPLSDAAFTAALPLETLLDLVRQAAEALAGAHEAGIVHRDIKPANVMVTGTGLVKLLDFGLARRHVAVRGPSDSTRSGEAGEAVGLAGTLAYMAPEQARGGPVDGRADMFSLGVLLYELLAGQRPFAGATPVVLLEAVLHDDPPPLASRFDDRRLPALERVVRRMLAKRAPDRFASLREVAAALAAVQRGADPEVEAAADAPAAVAVVGFVNITGNPDVEWLGTGLAETITAAVSEIDGLRALPHTRVHALLRTLAEQPAAAGEAPAVTAARELGARFVVTGGFQRSGGDVRVTATITELATGASRTIKVDGTLAGIFALQDTLVGDLAALLRSHRIAPRAGATETDVVEAYEAFSKGVANLRAETFESLDRAVLLFERAVALDARYGRAHLELGSALATKADYMAMPDLRERALASLRRGLELQPDSVKGWRDTGAALIASGREPEGVAAIRRALALDPEDAGALSAMGRALFLAQARFAEAAEYFDRALARNPNAGWYALQLAHCAALLREFERGERAARRAVALQQALLSGQEGVLVVGGAMRLGHLAALQGRHEEAVQHFLDEIALLSRVEHALRNRILVELNVRLGASYGRLGQRRKAEAAFAVALEGFDRRVRLGADDPFTRYYAAAAHALLGDVDTAFAFLERAAGERRAFTVARARIEPEFEALRQDPRFTRFLD